MLPTRVCKIETESLINAIKCRTALYNTKCGPDPANKEHRDELWHEVCRELFSDWDNLKARQQGEFCREAQRRWRNLRTSFAKELRIQKMHALREEREGRTIGRKKYEHYDQLKFLLGFVTHRSLSPIRTEARTSEKDSASYTPSNFKTDDNIESNGEFNDEPFQETSGNATAHQDFNQSYIVFEELDENKDTAPNASINEINVSRDSAEEGILQLLRECKKKEDNDDRRFLLSLLPSLEKLSDRNKFDAKIEILQIMKNITYPDG